ncbi:hypothetical protein TNCV_3506311 [Trichonephila clavipes]|uniref:Uncharacterized protein n=1 Tax=Trichonephila clavipes TaxID=2585209 RepID=A0A8X6S676_TRICX|nr:hypothetical protein TNCV_3506311 [Trichonephila clavipes]
MSKDRTSKKVFNAQPIGPRKKTATEAVGLIRQTVSVYTLGKSQVCEGFSRSKSDNMSIEDLPYTGCPSKGRSDENIVKIKRAIDEGL